jgi:hypothetical protein
MPIDPDQLESLVRTTRARSTNSILASYEFGRESEIHRQTDCLSCLAFEIVLRERGLVDDDGNPIPSNNQVRDPDGNNEFEVFVERLTWDQLTRYPRYVEGNPGPGWVHFTIPTPRGDFSLIWGRAYVEQASSTDRGRAAMVRVAQARLRGASWPERGTDQESGGGGITEDGEPGWAGSDLEALRQAARSIRPDFVSVSVGRDDRREARAKRLP